MKQNKYDDPEFFASYSQMARSVGGLEAAGEWHAFREMLPELQDRRVLDIGCGFGWHCRYARERKAASVIGIDLSENMLARARASTDDAAIEYRCMAIEDMAFDGESFDVVISSLALHYIESFESVCRNIYRFLAPGGTFVFSVEHPIFTAVAAQDWVYDAEGERLHWPVDHYQSEGVRQTRFLDNDVVKYHRTFASYIQTLLESGFTIAGVSEPKPPQQMLKQVPGMRDELRRPMFLMIAATKPMAPIGTHK